MTAPESTPRDDITSLREVIREAISGSWSTMPTCWEAQTSAVLAALPSDLLNRGVRPVDDDMDLRDEAIGRAEGAEEAIARALALCDEYDNYPECRRPLAVKTAQAFRAALGAPGGEMDRLRAELTEAQERADWLRGHAEWLSNERDALKAASETPGSES